VTELIKAAVLTAVNKPLEIQEFPAPAPSTGGAVVTVAYAGICGTDIHLKSGNLPVPMPIVMGHEAVGTIAALDPALSTDINGAPLRVGDRVVWSNNIPCGRCHECLVLKERTLCKSRKIYGINRTSSDAPHLLGGMAGQIALEAGTAIIRIPDEVSFEEVIALGCAGPTALHGMLENLTIHPGDTVAVQGSGPVGLAAAIYAKQMGADQVILLGAPASRLELALEIGACDEVIDMGIYTDSAARLEKLRQMTAQERGADVVIECAGVPAAVAESLDLARPNGQVLVLGQYTDHGATPINPHYITKKQLKIFGSWGFAEAHYVKYVESLPQLRKRHDLGALLTVFALEDVNEAMDTVAAGQCTKAVLKP
jgi:threonine dehydrogenase-like Zn-dependent dehydrogenase